MPLKLVVVGAAAAATILLARRGGSKQTPGKGNVPLSPHLAAAVRPVTRVPDAPPPPVKKRQYAAVIFSLLATTLVSVASYICILRDSWDVAAAISMAWILLLLQQAIQGTGINNDDKQAAAHLAAADASIKEEPLKLPDISGTWIKDNDLSDPMDQALAMMHLNGLMRTAVKLVKGVKISLTEEEFDMAVFSIISWFKVVEKYSLNGAVSTTRRRDMRRGQSRGVVSPTPHGTLLLNYEWSEPLTGHASDEFELGTDGMLRVTTSMTVGDQNTRYTQVYHRKQ